MKIRFLTSVAGNPTANRGDVVEVCDDEEAMRFIASHAAVAMPPAAPHPEPPPKKKYRAKVKK